MSYSLDKAKRQWHWAMERYKCECRYKNQIFLAEAYECAMDEGDRRTVSFDRMINKIWIMDSSMYMPLSNNDEDYSYIIIEGTGGGWKSVPLAHSSYAERISVIDDYVRRMLSEGIR